VGREYHLGKHKLEVAISKRGAAMWGSSNVKQQVRSYVREQLAGSNDLEQQARNSDLEQQAGTSHVGE